MTLPCTLYGILLWDYSDGFLWSTPLQRFELCTTGKIKPSAQLKDMLVQSHRISVETSVNQFGDKWLQKLFQYFLFFCWFLSGVAAIRYRSQRLHRSEWTEGTVDCKNVLFPFYMILQKLRLCYTTVLYVIGQMYFNTFDLSRNLSTCWRRLSLFTLCYYIVLIVWPLSPYNTCIQCIH